MTLKPPRAQPPETPAAQKAAGVSPFSAASAVLPEPTFASAILNMMIKASKGSFVNPHGSGVAGEVDLARSTEDENSRFRRGLIPLTETGG